MRWPWQKKVVVVVPPNTAPVEVIKIGRVGVTVTTVELASPYDFSRLPTTPDALIGYCPTCRLERYETESFDWVGGVRCKPCGTQLIQQ